MLTSIRMKIKKEENKIKELIKGPSLGYTDNYPNRSLWKEIADELQGEFKVKHNSGYELETHQVYIPHNNWEIIISVSDTKPLKLQVKFNTNFDFNLTISWEDFIEKVLKKIGFREIELGNTEFDKNYLIKSKKPDLVKSILNKEIQDIMLKYNIYSLSYQTDKKVRSSELISVIQRKVGSKEMIIELIDFFKLFINKLEDTKIIKRG